MVVLVIHVGLFGDRQFKLFHEKRDSKAYFRVISNDKAGRIFRFCHIISNEPVYEDFKQLCISYGVNDKDAILVAIQDEKSSVVVVDADLKHDTVTLHLGPQGPRIVKPALVNLGSLQLGDLIEAAQADTTM